VYDFFFQQKKLPVWPLYNAAGLFWRLEGKPGEAMMCLLRAYALAEADDERLSSRRGDSSRLVRSVPAANLAALIYRLGFLDDAVFVLNQTYRDDPKHVSS
jgi:hypothetical protein